jgi:hypothetical protein
MSAINLQSLLDKAVRALPPKSPVRTEISEALETRKLYTERAKKAWETMRSNKAKAEKPAPAAKAPATKPVKAKAKA